MIRLEKAVLSLTLAPFLSRSRVVARPIPWAAPVINATLLASMIHAPVAGVL